MSLPPPLRVAFRLGRDEVTISAGGEIDLASAADRLASRRRRSPTGTHDQDLIAVALNERFPSSAPTTHAL